MILQSQVLASGLVRTFVKPREGEQEIYQSGFLVPGKRVWGFRRYVREGTQDEVEGRLADTAPGEHISQSLRQLHRRVDGAGAQCVSNVAVRAGGGFRTGWRHLCDVPELQSDVNEAASPGVSFAIGLRREFLFELALLAAGVLIPSSM